MSAPSINRRDLLKTGALAGAGLVVGVSVARRADAQQPAAPNAFVRVAPDGAVTVVVPQSEMGQGVLTSLPMLVAEELEVDPATVRYEQAPTDAAYINPAFAALNMQGTGGSTSVRAFFEPLRRAGAQAREMLAAAAAQRLGVERSSLSVANGIITHAASGRRLTYGEVSSAAAGLTAPATIELKPSSSWRVIGRRVRRLDSPAKVTGRATFGIDVRMAGMLTAVIERSPVLGGRVASFDAARALRVTGVRQVVQVPTGVAVIADNFWAAKKGREALTVRWEGGNSALSSDAIRARYAELAANAGVTARHEGDAAAVLASAARKIEAVYEVPYLAHATMEPMNCTAHVRADGVDVWAPTQGQTFARLTAAQIAGVPPQAVTVHTTMLGGGFGRRFEQDFIAEAVAVAKETRAPVKLMWTREDDMRSDQYRPATYNVLAGAVGADGLPAAWTHRIVGPSIFQRILPAFVQNGIDGSSVEGAADLPYAVPNIHVDWVHHETGVPVGFWRSVGNSQNAFIKECFLDELAAAGSIDPVALRRRLLGDARHRRLLGVLDLAAERADWGSALPAGRARGVALHESFGSYVAEVAEVSMEGDVPRVHRVVCAVDCGQVVNPLTVEAQMQSSIVYGLSAALRGAITVADGRIVQSNFHDYAPLRLNEMPVVETHIVPSSEAPGGVGEPGTPPIAPAVCNAIYALTGRRIRKLPILQA